jgi:hypothetical protein
MLASSLRVSNCHPPPGAVTHSLCDIVSSTGGLCDLAATTTTTGGEAWSLEVAVEREISTGSLGTRGDVVFISSTRDGPERWAQRAAGKWQM